MTGLSIVIPHKNRSGMLQHHLDLLCDQSTKEFEVIIVDDGSDENHRQALEVLRNREYPYTLRLYDQGYPTGPGAARNTGAEVAESDIILFVGDDCLPTRHLVFQHIVNHRLREGEIAVQGFSPFARRTMCTRFMHWLDNTGIQANWRAAFEDDGRPKELVPGFCITTNYSISKNLFLSMGGFDSLVFKNAAWEDIAFGYLGQNIGVDTYFNPDALNEHYHMYDLEGFINRQKMVGKNILALALKHPEIAAMMINPEELRAVKNEHIGEFLHKAHELETLPYDNVRDAIEDIWGQCIRIALLNGYMEECERRGGAYQVFEHLHKKETATFAYEGIKGMYDNSYGWTMHAVNWMLEDVPDNWAVLCYAAEAYKFFGDMDNAYYYYMKSIERAPNEWGKEGLKEIG